METQIQSYYKTPQGIKFISLFGYATKGVPGLEITGVGKLSRNIREKLIFLSRSRRLPIPLRRYVVCVDTSELESQNSENLQWLEFPILLLYWHMAGLVPISKLNDCLCSGQVKANGEIIQMYLDNRFAMLVEEQFNHKEKKDLKIIDSPTRGKNPFWLIESRLLLEHIKDLRFKKELSNTFGARSITQNLNQQSLSLHDHSFQNNLPVGLR